jgi:hypothetical protein
MSHVPQPPLKLSLDDFLRNFVFVSKDSMVVRINPYQAYRLRDFKNTYLPSGAVVEQWLRHPDRLTVERVAREPDIPELMFNDGAQWCLNLWALLTGRYPS